MHASRIFVCAAAALLVACGAHYVARGVDLYAGGYYVEAAEVFERTEDRLERSSPAERARYGLYRGASLLALGDSRHAERWLRYSRDILLTEEGALSSEEQQMLRKALGVVAQRRPAAPPAADGAAVATSQAAAPATGAPDPADQPQPAN